MSLTLWGSHYCQGRGISRVGRVGWGPLSLVVDGAGTNHVDREAHRARADAAGAWPHAARSRTRRRNLGVDAKRPDQRGDHGRMDEESDAGGIAGARV